MYKRQKMISSDVLIIGAGAAGCFTAAMLQEMNPHLRVTILEKTRQPLAKVKISGGGRCNVTHHCFAIQELIESYPRGKLLLQSAFSQFQPRDMIEWLERHGVELQVEADGRMFTKTNRSQTIVDCLMSAISGAQLLLEQEVVSIERGALWSVMTSKGVRFQSKALVMTTGGNVRMMMQLQELGLVIEPPVPSLFTSVCQDTWLCSLPGQTIKEAELSCEHCTVRGPLLVTHVGLSGPAMLKLSAFGARFFAEKHYKTSLMLSFVGATTAEEVRILLRQHKRTKKMLAETPCFALSKQLWKELVRQAHIPDRRLFAHLSKKEEESLIAVLTRTCLSMTCKNVHKEEFVTCGGVSLKEVSQKTLESVR